MKRIKAFMEKAKLRNNRKGGMEGLPLQLLIVIIIASLGLSMMVGWMNNIEEPASIGDVEVVVETLGDGLHSFSVTVYDNDGNRVENADVVVTGLGSSASSTTDEVPTAKTGAEGNVVIKAYLKRIHLHGYVEIEVSKPDMISKTVSVLVKE